MSDNETLSAEEIEQLRAENAELRRLMEAAEEQGAESHAKARNGWAIAIAILASLLITISVPAVWLNRVVFDTETWVRTVGPLASDPAIQDVVSDAASEALIEQLDSQALIDEYLPEELSILAGPISQAVDDFIRKQTDNVVRSDQFATIWEETNRVGHQALVAAVTGREGVANVEAGVISIDTGLLAETVKQKVVESGFGLANRIPTDAVSGELVLYESPVLAQLTFVFDAISRAAFVIPLFGLIAAGASLALAVDRRKAALWLGGGIVLAGLLPLQAIYLGQYYVVNQLQDLAGFPGDAAEAAYSIIFADLITGEQTTMFIGVVIWVSALVAGPARWAVAIRRGVGGGVEGIGSRLELGAFGAWIARNKTALRAVGFVIAVLALLALPTPRTISSVAVIIVGVLVWLLLVEILGSGSPTSEPAEEVIVVEAEEVVDGNAVEEPAEMVVVEEESTEPQEEA